MRSARITWMVLAMAVMHGTAFAAAPCAVTAGVQTPPFCRAVRGVRAEGWLEQTRSEVLAQHGMVVTSQPLAAQAGLDMLRAGGNAIDAAVAAAAVLTVVEPMMVGVAGDLFVVVYVAKEHKVYMLNASGTAPTGATPARLQTLGYHWDPKDWAPGSGMPVHGILPVTVPGAVWGWQAVLQRFGTLTFKEDLEPAARYAESGFPVSERIAADWKLPAALPLKSCCTTLDPDSIATWYVNGRPPAAGQVFTNPGLARTLRLLEAQGADAFYRGEIATAILAKSQKLGGTMTRADLAGYHGEWVEPAHTRYHGHDLYELPPPAQPWATNEMLNILDTCVPRWAPGETLASLGPASPRYWHFLVEAKKLAFADLYRYNADPHFADVPLDRLLSPAHAASLCDRVDPAHAAATGVPANATLPGDTIVLSTADAAGNMVSWVNSNYDEFGSGITVPGYGFVLHDRGALFTLDPHSPNVIAPGKRPFNTLSAGFLMHDGNPEMTVTLMGGDMQAQGHAQLLLNVIDLGANVQAATDMARFLHHQVRNVLALEAPLYELVGPALTAMGHTVESVNGEDLGGAQIIGVESLAAAPTSPSPAIQWYYRSGSDFRKDGEAVGW